MTSVHRTGRLRRPVERPTPSDAIFDAYFGKDLALPDTAPTAAPLFNAASDTDRLLKQSQDLLSRLRQAVEERGPIE